MKRKFNSDHEQRPRATPFQQTTARIRKGLAELGEPGASRDPVAFTQLANDLSTSDPEAWPTVFDMVAALVVEQPHKVPLLALIFEFVNQQRSAIPEQLVEFTHSRLQSAIDAKDVGLVNSWLRFACSLTVADRPHIVELLGQLLEGGNLPLVVTAIVYLKQANDSSDLAPIYQQIAEFCEKFEAPTIQSPVFGESVPYTPKSGIEHYVEAARHCLEKGWDTTFMPTLDSFGSRVEVAPKTTLKPVSISSPADLKPKPSAYTRIYLPQGDIQSVPEPSSLFGLILREVASDIVANMDFNRKEVTRQLMTLDLFFNEQSFAPPSTPFDQLQELKDTGVATIKAEEIAVEAVIAQMLRLPNPDLPPVYYHSILIEACIMFPSAAAPVLGRAIRFLFANTTSLDVDIYWRVLSWWAHHMSNFSFTWKWHEWTEFLELPKDHPKYVFMQQLVVKQVQLSYPSRVRDSLPSEFTHLVPEIPEVPEFKYANDEDVAALLVEIEANPSNIETSLSQYKQKLTDRLIGQEATQLASEYGTVVLTCLCQLGNRSITHATKWVERFAPLVKGNIAGQLVVEAVLDYWKQSPWVGLLVLDKLVNSGAIEGHDVSKHIVATQSLLLSSAGYDRLKLYGRSEQTISSDGEWSEWWSNRLAIVFDRVESVVKDESMADPTEPTQTEPTESEVIESEAVEPQPAEPPAFKSEPTESETVEPPVEAAEPVAPQTESSESQTSEPPVEAVEPES